MTDFTAEISNTSEKLADKVFAWFELLVLQLPNLLIACIIGFMAFYLSKYIRKTVTKGVQRFTNNQTILNLISNLTAVLVGTLAIFTILSVLNLGETINKLLATAGVLGLAVGLTLQDPMNNLFSCVFMSVRDLYNIGDLVETNGYFGKIIDLDLRATKLRIPTGQIIMIPNKDVIQKPLKNYTSSGERRVDISCGISYGDNLNKVEDILLPEIQKMESVLSHKPVDLVYDKFGDSSIQFTLRFWIDTTEHRDYLIERSNAIKVIKQTFDKHDIMIPFPIRTLDFGIRGGKPLKSMLNSQNIREMRNAQMNN